MKKLLTLIADEGKIVTDGEIYGRSIRLAEDRSESDFYEISQEEYDRIKKGERDAE